MRRDLSAIRAAGAGLLALFVLLVNSSLMAQTSNDKRAPFACTDLAIAASRPNTLRVTFLGVSTLLFDDGETQFLTDGFFSRPDFWRVLRDPIGPDFGRIDQALDRAGIVRLAAVIALHSHYDHVMDAPEVAKRKGALLIGSESTANVGRGSNLPEERIRVFRAGEKFTFGRFGIEIILSQHTPGSDGGMISQRLEPPVAASQYKEGGTYSILVRHNGSKLLIGERGETETVMADVVFLGLAALGQTDEKYWRQTWQRSVIDTGARRVIPIHWDNFFIPLEQGLQPFWVPDVGKVLKLFHSLGEATGVDVKCAPLWEKVDPLLP